MSLSAAMPITYFKWIGIYLGCRVGIYLGCNWDLKGYMRQIKEPACTWSDKERKVPTRTELWNNTSKTTLRYKVEKWVHGSEEKAGLVVSISLKVSWVSA